MRWRTKWWPEGQEEEADQTGEAGVYKRFKYLVSFCRFFLSLNVRRYRKQNMGDTEKGYLKFGDYNNRFLDNLNRVTEDTFEIMEALGEVLNSVGELAMVVVHLVQAGMVSLKNETLEHMPVFFLRAGVAAAAFFMIEKAAKKNETERMNIKEEIDNEEEF